MFRTIVQFVIPLTELDTEMIQTLESLSIIHDQHSSLIRQPQISLPDSGNTVERIWQDESFADEYIESLATYSSQLIVTKIAE
jgi:hypothetical protein